ncbi:unnamed protein product [Allacma fusca]|uniref:Uncharacterized protein n=1 Tax=Allacma fusca TaxID=39272 RepID=A0A8J2L7S7_9HEXA|nr:unnamed protein product [Allacma fusca]
MPEKVFFGLKSSMWGIVIAWNQIILCVLKLLHTIYYSAFMLYYHMEHSYTGDENLVATVSNITYEDSDIPFEFEESFQYGNGFS